MAADSVVSAAGGARQPTETSRSSRLASFVPYLVLGFAICLVAQLVLWLWSGSTGLLLWPFVWAYSQAAMLDGLIGNAGRAAYRLLWFAGYLALSVVLWLLLERWKAEHWGVWRRAFLGWLLAQAALGVLAWVLYTQGVIQME